MKCTTAAFQICTCSGYISCALCSSAQGTHSWIASKFTRGMYFGWEEQTSPFLRAEGCFGLLDSSLPIFWETKESPSGKRCSFCLSDINKNNKIRNGLQLLCLGASRAAYIKCLMFLRKTRAAMPFPLTLREHHQSHLSQAGTAGQAALLLKSKAQVHEEKRLCEDIVFGTVFAEDKSLFSSQPNSIGIREYPKNFFLISQSAVWLWNQALASLNFVTWIIHLLLRSVGCNEDNFEPEKVKLIQQQKCSMCHCLLYCHRAAQALVLGFIIPFPGLRSKAPSCQRHSSHTDPCGV